MSYKIVPMYSGPNHSNHKSNSEIMQLLNTTRLQINVKRTQLNTEPKIYFFK